MTSPGQAIEDAIAALLPPLLGTLDHVEWVQRHLYPPAAVRLAEMLAPHGPPVAAARAALEEAACPAEIAFVRDRLAEVAGQTVEIVDAFARAAHEPDDFIGLYRALRRAARVQEALYPLAPILEPVSRFFLEPGRRGDDGLVARLRAAALAEDVGTGVRHAANERDQRGGFSLYVPETGDGRSGLPL